MSNRALALISIPLLLSISIAATTLPAGAQEPDGAASHAEEVRVSEISLVVEGAPSDPAQVEVLEDGERRVVRRVDRVQDWQVLVYVDIPLSDHSTVVAGTQALAKLAEKLTGLGEVRLVVADAMPRDRLPPTRDPYDLREALLRVGSGPMGSHRLVAIRNELGLALQGAPDEVAEVAQRSLEAEIETVQVQLERLLGVGADTCSVGPCVLFLVTDGFDESPRTFYERTTSRSLAESSPRPSGFADRLGPLLSAGRWVVLPLPIRPKKAEIEDSERKRPPRSLFLRPDENESMISLRRGTPASSFDALEILLLPMSSPLLALAKASGGSVVRSPAQLDVRLRRLVGSQRIWYADTRAEPMPLLPVEVRRVKDGKVLRSQKWVGSQGSAELLFARLRGALEGWGSRGSTLPTLEVLDRSIEGDRIQLRLHLELEEGSVDSAWGYLAEDGRLHALEVTRLESTLLASLPVGARSLSVVGFDPSDGTWGAALVELVEEEE